MGMPLCVSVVFLVKTNSLPFKSCVGAHGTCLWWYGCVQLELLVYSNISVSSSSNGLIWEPAIP